MDYVLITISAILMLVGLIGCILPALPGPTLSYLGLVVLSFSDRVTFSTRFFIIWGIVALVVTILDYVIPIWGTKRFGGSKYGVWGSIIGLLGGLFFPPIGFILGPFAGAIVGEMYAGKRSKEMFRAGFGSFIGFLVATFIKILISGTMFFLFFKGLFWS
ncbi:DUF456 domain-containing protein [Prolixibacter denitrificans]|uniref:Membrane protein n=1 Tax=Prolixibacter denitrificans TaxID=1541063 RepID=A0A2P8CED2_9BACT|nr:DUF456 domain-containing protein [Prolixibacter denitrificans]PSK83337.1 hypothetical protein CLV93_104267 [Prolixibacter denitrificans]GET21782.1 membrane protein [Prolixibacter denitrificans]